MKILIVRRSDGQVLSHYVADSVPNAVEQSKRYGGPWGKNEYCEHVQCPDNIDESCVVSVDLTNIPEHWTKDGEDDSYSQPMRDVWTKEGEDDVYSQPLRAVWVKDGEDDVYEQPVIAEYWSKEGEDDVFVDPEDETYTYHAEVNDNSYTETSEADPSWIQSSEVDPAWTYVAAVTETVTEDSTKLQERRDNKLEQLRVLRAPLLSEVDIMINELSLGLRSDQQDVIDYRAALLDFTSTYKKVDGHAKVIIDSLDLDNISWPEKP